MYKQKTVPEMREIIKQAFKDFYVIARADTKRRAPQLKKEKHLVSAARGLVLMRAVSENPEQYFSRATTWGAWRKRNWEERQKHPEMCERDAYYIVQTPATIVYNDVSWAATGELNHKFFHLCEATMQWEYALTSNPNEQWRADLASEKVIKLANELRKMADIEQSKPIVAAWKQFKYSLVK